MSSTAAGQDQPRKEECFINQSVQQVFSVEPTDEDIKKAIKRASEPRCFTKQMKDKCWENATLMIGRDPSRWRLDAVGNPVARALTSCMGPLCHEYDHIVPFSKGGKTEVSNCQILQTIVNRYKSNKTDQTYSELKNISPTQKFTSQEFDAVERGIYGQIVKVVAEDQVKKASEQSLKIIYAQKELNSTSNANTNSNNHSQRNKNKEHYAQPQQQQDQQQG